MMDLMSAEVRVVRMDGMKVAMKVVEMDGSSAD